MIPLKEVIPLKYLGLDKRDKVESYLVKGDIKIGLNREKLARKIHSYWREQAAESGSIKCAWEDLHDAGREGYLQEADAILSNLKDLMECQG